MDDNVVILLDTVAGIRKYLAYKWLKQSEDVNLDYQEFGQSCLNQYINTLFLSLKDRNRDTLFNSCVNNTWHASVANIEIVEHIVKHRYIIKKS